MKVLDLSVDVRRGDTVPVEQLLPRTVALDGAVRGPHIDLAAQRISFDHHDHCVRMVTSATCVQVLDALCVGFDPSGWTVLVNDVDGDTALSVALLARPELVDRDDVRALVDVVGKVDAHGPAYRLTATQAGIADRFYVDAMAPEQSVRRDGSYGTADLEFLLAECVGRIYALIDDDLAPAGARPERHFDVVTTGDRWVLAESADFCFDLIYRAGWDAAVVCSPQPDGSFAYTVGRRSDLVEYFDVPAILARLDELEPGWSGGTSIGGAPRNADGSRSQLTPTQVRDVVTQVVTTA
jgi:hypothetical protein